MEHPEEIARGYYQASVEGTDVYTVDYHLKNGVMMGYGCTCPYDMGPVCKHIAAVIFYLQQDALNMDMQPLNKKGRPKKAIQKPVEHTAHTQPVRKRGRPRKNIPTDKPIRIIPPEQSEIVVGYRPGRPPGREIITRKREPVRKTVAGQIDYILKQLTHDQLTKGVAGLC